MMILPGPGVLNVMVRDRQKHLRTTRRSADTTRQRGTLRARVGHVLIVAGSALGGERVERPARPSAMPRAS
jgi:hypothetical protein